MRPQALAAAWFGATALVASSLWFLPDMLRRSLFTHFHLMVYGVFPCSAAAASGWLLGAALADPEAELTLGQAFLQGAGVALFATVINAPLAAIYAIATARDAQGNTIYGAFLIVLLFSLIALGWSFALVGGLSGMALRAWRRKRRPS